MNEFIASGSYFAIFATIVATGLGLPIPEEVPIVAAGVLSSPDVARLDPWVAFTACFFGAIVGDSAMYAIGRWLGRTRVRNHRLLARLFNEEREQQMERFVDEHGIKVLFAARFLVGVRGPLYLASGMARVNYRRFLVADVICGGLVVGLFFWLSYFFGGRIGPLIRESQLAATIAVIVVVAGGAIYYVFWRRFQKQLQSTYDRASTQSPPEIEE